jgi:hypothetical protein
LIIVAFGKPNSEISSRKVFSDYFNQVSWVTRDGEVSLSIDHKKVNVLDQTEAFQILEDLYSSDPNWKNRDSLYAQFCCHVQFAFFKNPWNLEPARTTTSLLTTILNKCNPAKFFEFVR